MPPRFQQQKLASPVVGTPGLDKSAGAVEAQIAQSADAMNAGEDQATMLDLRKAEQSFDQARGMFMYVQQQQRHQAALDKQIADEQRRLQVGFDRIEEDDKMNVVLKDLKSKFSANPYQAVTEFETNLPVMRQQFKENYAVDQQRLRMLMPGQRASEKAAQNELQNWARTTTNQNLSAKLALLPEQMAEKVSNLSGSIDEQLLGFQKTLTSNNSVYDTMRASSMNQAAHDEILTKQLQLNKSATNQFVNHLVAQTPEGEAGIKHIDNLVGIVKSAKMYGLPMSPDDQKQQMSALQSVRNAHEQEVVTGIQGETTIKILDANKLKADLYNAANDPKAMTVIARQVQTRLSGLDARIAEVSKEPESKVRNAKLSGLKQEQNAFITELGMDLKLSRSFDQLQRTLTSFAQGQIGFQQGQLRFQQGQMMFMQGQDKRAATEVIATQKQAFNDEWAKTQTAMFSALGHPQGVKQQQAVHEVVKNAIPILTKAAAAGLMDANEYNTRLSQLSSKAEAVSAVITTKDWFGYEHTNPLKENEKKKAAAQVQSQFGQMVQREQGNFLALQSSVDQLHAITTTKAEKAFLTQYMTAHMPKLLDSAGYTKLSPQDQTKRRAAAISDMVRQFRAGTLK